MFAVVKDLMVQDIGGVELAIVQKRFREDMKKLMVAPYYSDTSQQARLTVRVTEASKELRRDEFLCSVRVQLEVSLGLITERVQLTGMLVLYNNVFQSLQRSQILTSGAVIVAILVMFLVLFGSFSLALFTLVPNLLAAGVVLGTMGLVGIPLDIMPIAIAAMAVGIGVDDCTQYVRRFIGAFRQDRNYRATMDVSLPSQYWPGDVLPHFHCGDRLRHVDPVQFQPQHLFRHAHGAGDGGSGIGRTAAATIDDCIQITRSRGRAVMRGGCA